MKENELRELAACGVCGKKIGHTGLPMFWKVTVERFGLNGEAVKRQQGLGMMIGAQLAHVMGPGEDLAMPLIDPVVLSVCEWCAVKPVMVCDLAERGINDDAETA